MALGRGNIEIDVSANVDTQGIVRQVNDAQRKLNRNPITIGLNEKGFTQPLGRITGDLAEFQKSLDASVARTLAFGAAVGVLNSVADGFKGIINSAVEVEKSLADINVILNLTASSLSQFSSDLFSVAKNTGQTFQTVSEAAVELSRQGLGAEETLKRINDAMILTRLSGMDAAKSVETLTAAVNSFGDTALTTTELVNKLATVDAAFAVSTEDLANALARAGSTAQGAKVNLDELLAAVTSVQQITARGGSVIGNAFKSIFTRIQRSGVREALEEIGVATTTATGDIRNALDIIKDYAGVYSTLTDAQRAYTDELVAGVFQINNFKALVKDLGSDYSIYERALRQSNGATDEAVKRNEELQSTLAALINESAVNVKQLSSALGELVATPAVENLLNIFNKLSGAFTEALEGEGVIKKVFEGIGRFISGPGLVLISVAFVKLFKFITSQAGTALKEVFNIGSAKNKIADAEARIGFLLQNNRNLYEAISNEALDHQQKEELVLNTIRAQNEAYKRQQGLVSGLARNPAIVQQLPSAASGHIPNFAKGLEGAINSEKQAINAGVGGASKSAKPKVLRNFPMGKGKKQTVVANTDEVIVPNYGGGDGSAIFNKNMIKKSGGVPKGAIPVSSGLIPNFAKGKDPKNKIGFKNSKIYLDTLGEYSEKKDTINFEEVLGGVGLIAAKGPNRKVDKSSLINPISKLGGKQAGIELIGKIAGSRLNDAEKSELADRIARVGKVNYTNIGVASIGELESVEAANKIVGKFGAINDVIGPYIANATSAAAVQIYSRLFGDEIKAKQLVSSVYNAANTNISNVVGPDTEGNIFEAAIRLGSEASAQNFGLDPSSRWDFEPDGNISQDLKNIFFDPINYGGIVRADAKRQASDSMINEVIDKAYEPKGSSSWMREALEDRHARFFEPLVSSAIQAKNAAGGFIPNFKNTRGQKFLTAYGPLKNKFYEEREKMLKDHGFKIYKKGVYPDLTGTLRPLNRELEKNPDTKVSTALQEFQTRYDKIPYQFLGQKNAGKTFKTQDQMLAAWAWTEDLKNAISSGDSQKIQAAKANFGTMLTGNVKSKQKLSKSLDSNQLSALKQQWDRLGQQSFQSSGLKNIQEGREYEDFVGWLIGTSPNYNKQLDWIGAKSINPPEGIKVTDFIGGGNKISPVTFQKQSVDAAYDAHKSGHLFEKIKAGLKLNIDTTKDFDSTDIFSELTLTGAQERVKAQLYKKLNSNYFTYDRDKFVPSEKVQEVWKAALQASGQKSTIFNEGFIPNFNDLEKVLKLKTGSFSEAQIRSAIKTSYERRTGDKIKANSPDIERYMQRYVSAIKDAQEDDPVGFVTSYASGSGKVRNEQILFNEISLALEKAGNYQQVKPGETVKADDFSKGFVPNFAKLFKISQSGYGSGFGGYGSNFYFDSTKGFDTVVQRIIDTSSKVGGISEKYPLGMDYHEISDKNLKQMLTGVYDAQNLSRLRKNAKFILKGLELPYEDDFEDYNEFEAEYEEIESRINMQKAMVEGGKAAMPGTKRNPLPLAAYSRNKERTGYYIPSDEEVGGNMFLDEKDSKIIKSIFSSHLIKPKLSRAISNEFYDNASFIEDLTKPMDENKKSGAIKHSRFEGLGALKNYFASGFSPSSAVGMDEANEKIRFGKFKFNQEYSKLANQGSPLAKWALNVIQSKELDFIGNGVESWAIGNDDYVYKLPRPRYSDNIERWRAEMQRMAVPRFEYLVDPEDQGWNLVPNSLPAKRAEGIREKLLSKGIKSLFLPRTDVYKVAGQDEFFTAQERIKGNDLGYVNDSLFKNSESQEIAAIRVTSALLESISSETPIEDVHQGNFIVPNQKFPALLSHAEQFNPFWHRRKKDWFEKMKSNEFEQAGITRSLKSMRLAEFPQSSIASIDFAGGFIPNFVDYDQSKLNKIKNVFSPNLVRHTKETPVIDEYFEEKGFIRQLSGAAKYPKKAMDAGRRYGKEDVKEHVDLKPRPGLAKGFIPNFAKLFQPFVGNDRGKGYRSIRDGENFYYSNIDGAERSLEDFSKIREMISSFGDGPHSMSYIREYEISSKNLQNMLTGNYSSQQIRQLREILPGTFTSETGNLMLRGGYGKGPQLARQSSSVGGAGYELPYVTFLKQKDVAFGSQLKREPSEYKKYEIRGERIRLSQRGPKQIMEEADGFIPNFAKLYQVFRGGQHHFSPLTSTSVAYPDFPEDFFLKNLRDVDDLIEQGYSNGGEDGSIGFKEFTVPDESLQQMLSGVYDGSRLSQLRTLAKDRIKAADETGIGFGQDSYLKSFDKFLRDGNSKDKNKSNLVGGAKNPFPLARNYPNGGIVIPSSEQPFKPQEANAIRDIFEFTGGVQRMVTSEYVGSNMEMLKNLAKHSEGETERTVNAARREGFQGLKDRVRREKAIQGAIGTLLLPKYLAQGFIPNFRNPARLEGNEFSKLSVAFAKYSKDVPTDLTLPDQDRLFGKVTPNSKKENDIRQFINSKILRSGYPIVYDKMRKYYFRSAFNKEAARLYGYDADTEARIKAASKGLIPNFAKALSVPKEDAFFMPGKLGAIIGNEQFDMKQVEKSILDVFQINKPSGKTSDASNFARSYSTELAKSKNPFSNKILNGKYNFAGEDAEGNPFIPLLVKDISNSLKGLDKFYSNRGKYKPTILGRSGLSDISKENRFFFGSRAEGFIPNFASAIDEAIKREKTALESQGSNAKVYIDKDSRLKNQKNPMGLLVANTRDEPRGGSQGVNRAISERKNPKTYGAATGFVPNYITGAGVQKTSLDGKVKKNLEDASKALKDLGDSAEKTSKNTEDLDKKTEELSRSGGDAVMTFFKIQAGIQSAETAVRALVPGMEDLSLTGIQATSSLAQFTIQSEKLQELKIAGPVTGLIVGLGALSDAFEQGLFKAQGFYNVQADLNRQLEESIQKRKNELDIISQNIEKIDTFTGSLNKLGELSGQGKIEESAKVLQELIEQGGQLSELDPSAFNKLIDSVGDSDEFKKAAEDFKAAAQQGKSVKQFGQSLEETFQNLNKGIQGQDIAFGIGFGSDAKFFKEAEMSFQAMTDSLVKGMDNDSVLKVAEDMRGLDGSLLGTSSQISVIENAVGGLNDVLRENLNQYPETTSALFSQIQAQIEHQEAIIKATEAFKRVQSRIDPLTPKIKALANAMSVMAKSSEAAIKSLSKTAQIEATSRVESLQSSKTVSQRDLLVGKSVGEERGANAESAAQMKIVLDNFSAQLLETSKISGITLTDELKPVIEKLAEGGSLSPAEAIESLSQVLSGSGSESGENKLAQETLNQLRQISQSQIAGNQERKAQLQASLQKLDNQAKAALRGELIQEQQLNALGVNTDVSDLDKRGIDALQKQISILEKLGGSNEQTNQLIAEMKERLATEIKSQNIQDIASSILKINTGGLDANQILGQIEKARQGEAEGGANRELLGFLERLVKGQEKGGGIAGEKEVAEAARPVISEESINNLSQKFSETISQPLQGILNIPEEIAKKINVSTDINSLAKSVLDASDKNQKSSDDYKAASAEMIKAMIEPLKNADFGALQGSVESLQISTENLLAATRNLSGAQSASGFIPNFAPTNAVSKALSTERNMGAKKPVLDSHPSVGPYVRDAATQPNFSAVKRDHPEGIRNAIQNSKTLQGNKAGGFVPNFYAVSGGYGHEQKRIFEVNKPQIMEALFAGIHTTEKKWWKEYDPNAIAGKEFNRTYSPDKYVNYFQNLEKKLTRVESESKQYLRDKGRQELDYIGENTFLQGKIQYSNERTKSIYDQEVKNGGIGARIRRLDEKWGRKSFQQAIKDKISESASITSLNYESQIKQGALSGFIFPRLLNISKNKGDHDAIVPISSQEISMFKNLLAANEILTNQYPDSLISGSGISGGAEFLANLSFSKKLKEIWDENQGSLISLPFNIGAESKAGIPFIGSEYRKYSLEDLQNTIVKMKDYQNFVKTKKKPELGASNENHEEKNKLIRAFNLPYENLEGKTSEVIQKAEKGIQVINLNKQLGPDLFSRAPITVDPSGKVITTENLIDPFLKPEEHFKNFAFPDTIPIGQGSLGNEHPKAGEIFKQFLINDTNAQQAQGKVSEYLQNYFPKNLGNLLNSADPSRFQEGKKEWEAFINSSVKSIEKESQAVEEKLFKKDEGEPEKVTIPGAVEGKDAEALKQLTAEEVIGGVDIPKAAEIKPIKEEAEDSAQQARDKLYLALVQEMEAAQRKKTQRVENKEEFDSRLNKINQHINFISKNHLPDLIKKYEEKNVREQATLEKQIKSLQARGGSSPRSREFLDKKIKALKERSSFYPNVISQLKEKQLLFDDAMKGQAELWFADTRRPFKVDGKTVSTQFYESPENALTRFLDLKKSIGVADKDFGKEGFEAFGKNLSPQELLAANNINSSAPPFPLGMASKIRKQNGNMGNETGAAFERMYGAMDTNAKANIMEYLQLQGDDQQNLPGKRAGVGDNILNVISKDQQAALLQAAQDARSKYYISELLKGKSKLDFTESRVEQMVNMGVPVPKKGSKGIFSGTFDLETPQFKGINILEEDDFSGLLRYLTNTNLAITQEDRKGDQNEIPPSIVDLIRGAENNKEISSNPAYKQFLVEEDQTSYEKIYKMMIADKANESWVERRENFDKIATYSKNRKEKTYGVFQPTQALIEAQKKVDENVLVKDQLKESFEGEGNLIALAKKIIGERTTHPSIGGIFDILDNTNHVFPELGVDASEQSNKFKEGIINISKELGKQKDVDGLYFPGGITREFGTPNPDGDNSRIQAFINFIEKSIPNILDVQNGNARGFIPNFSKVAGEIAASKSAGYKSAVTASQVKNINIPGVGKATYNTQESVFKNRGMSQPFIVPPANSDAAKPYAKKVQKKFNFNPYSKNLADGFVPNFASGLNTSEFDNSTRVFSESVGLFERFGSTLSETFATVDFSVLTTASNTILEASKEFGLQSQNIKDAATSMANAATAGNQEGVSANIDFSPLSDASSQISQGVTKLSEQLNTPISIDASDLQNVVNDMKNIQLSVDVPNVNVNVAGVDAATNQIKAAVAQEVQNKIRAALSQTDFVSKTQINGWFGTNF